MNWKLIIKLLRDRAGELGPASEKRAIFEELASIYEAGLTGNNIMKACPVMKDVMGGF